MKKSKILILVLTLTLLLGIVFAMSALAFVRNDIDSGKSLSEDSWIASPSKTLVKCPGGDCNHETCDYVYSFAVVGDTQNLNYLDAENYVAALAKDPTLTYEGYTAAHMRTLYNWIRSNKDEKNIQYVMGLGDVTQSFSTSQTYYDEEWALAKEAVSLLDGEIGYSLVRGNHDISSGFNGTFGIGTGYYNSVVGAGTDDEGRPMAEFRVEGKIEDSYRKIIIGKGENAHKYIIFTLEHYPTEETVTWLSDILDANKDYDAIITLHAFLHRDGTFLDDNETATPAEDAVKENWKETATGGNVSPRDLWENCLSEHENVKLILSGHVDVEDIVVNQLKGKNGNTVTCMLIDGQTIDSEVEPVGLVAMFYVAADGSVMNVEYISTVRAAVAGKNAYLKADNQFEITLDYGDSWTKTAYGEIPTEIYNASKFHIILDDDSVVDKTNFYFGGYNTWEETLSAIHTWNGKDGITARALKTYNILMTGDYTFSSATVPDTSGLNPGKIVLDLNRNKVTIGESSTLIPYQSYHTEVISSLTIKNGYVVMAGNSDSELVGLRTSKNTAEIEINLENLDVTYSGASSVVGMYGGVGGASYKSTVNLNVVDCTINTTGASSAVTVFNVNDSSNNNDVKFNLVGGSIVGTTYANTTLFALNDGADTVTFSKDSNGNYTTVSLTENKAPTGVFRNEEGKLLNFVTESTEAPYVFATELAPVEETPYGDISTDTYPADTYPFVLFQNGESVKGYEKYSDFIVDAAIVTVDSTLYLRRDYDTANDSYPSSGNKDRNLYNLKAKLTIDLGGNNFTRSSTFKNHLIQAYGTNGVEIEINIEIKNGTVIANNYLIYFNNHYKQDTSVPPEETFNITFSGVTLVAGSAGNFTNIGGNGNGSYGNIEFNDCTFDLQNANSGFVPFELEGSNTLVDINVVINGGTVKSNAQISKLANFSASGDSLKFGKSASSGNYVSFVLPKETAAPTFTFTPVDASKTLSLRDDSNDTNAIYQLGENVVTKYGTIPFAHADAEKYPFVLFQNGKCVAAYKKWNNGGFVAGLSSLDTSKEKETVVLMRRDYSTNEDSGNSYGFNTVDTLTIDFGGYTMTRGERHIFQLYSQSSNVNAKITVINGTVMASKNYGSPININGASATAGLSIVFNVRFENITFTSTASYAGELVVTPNDNGTYGSTTYLTFDNCSFVEGGTNVRDIFRLRSESNAIGGKYDVHVVVNGGSFTLVEDVNIIPTYVDSEDSIKFGTYNGAYTKIIKNSGAEEPKETFVSVNGKTLSLRNDSNDTNAIFQLGEDVKISYGAIPFAYADAEQYPFVLFKNGSVIYAFSSWYRFIETDVVSETSYRSGCVLVLRRDYITNEGDSQNMCYIDDIVIDLCGNKLTRGSTHLFQAYGKKGIAKTTKVTVKNGVMLTGASKSLIAFNNSGTNTGSHSFNFVFEDVIFGRAAGSSAVLIAESFTSGKYGSNNTITLNKCTINLVDDAVCGTVAPTAAVSWFDLQDNRDEENYKDGINSIKVVINGGEVKISSAAYLNLGSMDKAGDSIVFDKVDVDAYTKFNVLNGNGMPEIEVNGGELVFVKDSEDEAWTTYKLVSAAAENINFIPKTSITLSNALIYNVYVPVSAALNSFTLDGKEYSDLESLTNVVTLSDGKQYYRFEIELPAPKAARDIVLVASVTVGDETYSGSWTMNIPKYAKTIIEKSSVDVEKQLAKDVIAYVAAAYEYFGTKENDEAEIERVLNLIYEILAIGGEYSGDPTFVDGAVNTVAPVNGVTLNLDAKPTIRFFVTDTDVQFYLDADHKEKIKTRSGMADGKSYVELDVYAYALCETIYYGDGGSYHISDFLKKSAGTEDEYLVCCFIVYTESAAAYRESVIASGN